MDLKGLGRLCESPQSSGIKSAPDEPGLSRIGAQLYGNAYEPHRHDTYSIGFTMAGVQAFSYRGETRYSLPGNIIVLHPDELHDGGAGNDDQLVYRMLYLEPSVLRQAMENETATLPFLPDPVISDERLMQALSLALADLENGLDDLALCQLLTELADGLNRHADTPTSSRTARDIRAARHAREYLNDNLLQPVTSADLETAANMDRFALSRQFRNLYGTSPHRYLIMRRLELAKRLMRQGTSLAETALETGFSDQSHFNRHFKKAFGMSPGMWNTLTSKA